MAFAHAPDHAWHYILASGVLPGIEAASELAVTRASLAPGESEEQARLLVVTSVSMPASVTSVPRTMRPSIPMLKTSPTLKMIPALP